VAPGGSRGIHATGYFGFAGIEATAGATGAGMLLTGGATSGDALSLTTAGSGNLITDDAITSGTIATDAIGSAELASTAALEIADTVWDEVLTQGAHNVAQSSGKRIRDIEDATIITEGQAQGGSATTITLAAATSFADGILAGNRIVLIGGTGSGQSRHIEQWTSSSDLVTLHVGDDWTTNPDATTEYKVEPSAPADVAHISDSALSEMWNFPLTTITSATGIGRTLRDTSSATLTAVNALNDFDPTSDAVANVTLTATTTTVTNQVTADVTAISGVSAVADNLEEILDDDGVGSDMDLNNLHIVATGTNDTGFVIRGDLSGSGLFIEGGATGIGVSIKGGGGSGVGLLVNTTSGDAVQFTGGTNSDAFQLTGTGTGAGMVIVGGATGHGLTATGGTNRRGISALGGGTNAGIYAEGGATGNGMELVGGATSGDALALSVTSGDLIESAARDEIALSTWNTSALTAFTSGAMGDSAIGGVNTWGQGGAGLTAADIVAIADTIFHRDSSDVNDGDATSYGTLLMKPAYVQGSASGLTATKVADTVWGIAFSTAFGAGSMGDSLNNATYVQGTPPAGANVRGFYVIDTSGTDDTLSGVTISLQDATGSNLVNLITSSSGLITTNMADGNHTAAAISPGFVFIDTIFSATGNDTLSIKGYNVTVGAPAGGNEVRIFGFAYDVIDTADAMGNVWAFIELVKTANNTCDSTLTVPRTKRELTGSDGQFQFDVVRSSCLSDTDYRIWLKWDGGETKRHIFTAPDQATFKILW